MELDKGSTWKNLLKLSWPLMIAMSFHFMFNVVDAIYLGRYSTEAFSAVALTFPVIFLIIAIVSGIGIGTTSVISRKLGAKKQGEAEKAASQSINLGIFTGILFTFIGLSLARVIFKFITKDPVLIELVIDYVNIIFGGSMFFVLSFIVNSILRGEGDTKTPMKIMVTATIINLILDPLMIYGLLGFPEMGVKGAAWATVISRFFAFAYGYSYIKAGKAKIHIIMRKYDSNIIKKILKVGIPTSISQMLLSFGMLVMTKIVASLGTLYIAAFGIFGRLDSVAVMPIFAIDAAAITIVGYNYGAKNFDRIEKTVWAAVIMTISYGTFIGALFFFFPTFFVSVFNTDVIVQGTEIIKIVALFTGIASVQIVIAGAFQGIGKATPAVFFMILRYYILMIPLAIYLLTISTKAMWWSFPVSGVVTAVASAWYFKTRINRLRSSV